MYTLLRTENHRSVALRDDNIRKNEGGPDYVVSVKKASSVKRK